MAKNNSASQRFAKANEQALANGYIPVPSEWLHRGKGSSAAGPQWEDVLNATFAGADTIYGSSGSMKEAGAGVFSSVGNIVRTNSTIGTKELGWVEWGLGNKLPNVIGVMTNLLPYTAVGARFNTDTCAGLGPVAKYRYSDDQVWDFDMAGEELEKLLLSELEKYRAFLNGQADVPSTSEQNQGEQTTDNGQRTDGITERIKQRYEMRIKKLEDLIAKWEKTNEEVKTFCENTNLDLVTLELMNDMVMYNICFPQIELSSNAVSQKNTAVWTPKVVSLSYKSAHTCRLEEMDSKGKINYVYNSNRWLDHSVAVTNMADDDIIAIPAIDFEHPARDLKSKIAEIRMNKGERTTQYILPSYYPTVGRPYYPQPHWHSIFGGQIYSYISTIVSDRATRRKNRNVIGRIVYVHVDYLTKLQMQMGAKSKEEINKVTDDLWSQIDEFLGNPDNAGQSLMSFKFNGNDGKEHDAFTIVDIPNANSNEAKANETELQELTAIIFSAMMIHPELLGAVPGSSGRQGGGTYLREMFLIKQMMMAPTQKLVLQALNVAKAINEWDEHLVWQIKTQILTTLDNSKTGLVDSAQ